MKYMEKDTEEQADIFSALSDSTRLKLVKLLCQQQARHALCVNSLADRLAVSQSAVSQHLRVLKSAGLVKAQKRGTHVHYFIDRENVEHVQSLMVSALNMEAPAGQEACLDCSKVKIPSSIPVRRGIKINVKPD
jgi:ArsR family transcriptional regulator, arsenate/arsenite/antimonite-responsive transcriptional repressor